MEKIIALYDSDTYYATRFMEYFNSKKEFNFEISVFTKRESIVDFLKSNNVEILLLDDKLSMEELSIENAKYLYLLSEDPNKRFETPHACVYRYQSASAIMRELINDYIKKENISNTNNTPGQTEIISIFSPVSGVEKLSFSWSVGSLESEQSKVLLILLDLFPIQLFSLENYSNQSLTEFIYYLKENSDIMNKMKQLVGLNGNLSCLSGIIHGADILSLNKEDIQRWIEELKLHSDYQTIIFQIGCYTEAMIELMNLSDSVVVTSQDTPYETAVLKEWERQMSKTGINIKQEKFQMIKFQNDDNFINIPITMSELKQSTTWSHASQFRNIQGRP